MKDRLFSLKVYLPWYVKMEIHAPLQIEGMALGWLTLPIEITMVWMIVCREFLLENTSLSVLRQLKVQMVV